MERFCVNILFLLILMSFQIYAFSEGWIKLFYNGLIVFLMSYVFYQNLVSKRHVFNFFIVLVIIILISIQASNTRLVVYFIYMSIGYLILANGQDSLNPAVNIFICINTLLMVIQLTGKIPLLNSYQFYYPDVGDWQFVELTSENVSFAPINQWRPSGIFPSTIFLSAIQVLIVAYLYLKNIAVNNTMNLVLALMFAVTASTATVGLSLIILIFGKNRKSSYKFFVFYLFWIVVYINLVPDYFVQMNFSWVDLANSFFSRLYLTESGAANSAIAAYKFQLLWSCLILIIFLKFVHRSNVLKATPFIIFAIVPLVIHDFLSASFYWLFLGIVYALYSSRKQLAKFEHDN